jgi:uncharacterized protein YkwD
MSRFTRIIATTVAAIALAPAASAAAACADVNLVPTRANAPKVRAAVQCLTNQTRAARGLRTLKFNDKLRRAAESHSAWMVSASRFEHGDLAGRIRSVGYTGWTYGENIAWATGRLATAREIHRSWMNSPGHKANILRPQFREIGIGVALGAAGVGSNGATYTVDFGARR